jgi:hypothetical protein
MSRQGGVLGRAVWFFDGDEDLLHADLAKSVEVLADRGQRRVEADRRGLFRDQGYVSAAPLPTTKAPPMARPSS